MTTPLTARHLGIPEESCSQLSPDHAAQLAATLDIAAPRPGDPLPLLWHWAFFVPTTPARELGVDGHPLLTHDSIRGLPRRMWAGGRVRQHSAVLLGTPAVRRSTVISADRKVGTTGTLLVVTVRHEISQSGDLVVVEEQDLIYREPPAAPLAPPTGDVRPSTPVRGWCEEVVVDHATLFRFSALTFNAHRIHYDEPYATGVEGYPGLVVHGPLTALLLVEAARRWRRTGTTFTFRASAPLFAKWPCYLVGSVDGDAVDLTAVRSDGKAAVTAQLS